jgi:mRNA interferase YafQ
MKSLLLTGKFRRDWKRLERRGYDRARLDAIVDAIRSGEPLPISARAHKLQGEWKGFWDCHIAGDWVLIYEVTGDEVTLVRTGTHSDLFGD